MTLRLRIPALFILVFAVANSMFAQNNSANNEIAIRKVVDNFRIALEKKDKPLYLSLFFDGKVSWQSVTEDNSLARLRLKQPTAPKIAGSPSEDHLTFINWIASDPKSTVETFSNIKISTDGDIAFVGSDYKFLYDGRETNRGKEFWLLVRTESGWKITSVAWSETLPIDKAK